MKRLSCSDSLGVIYTHEEKKPEDNCDYSREFQSMLDGLEYDDSAEECGQSNEKKRRLRIDQVKAMEKIFEVDNKLDPERKLKLAQELGLQPRQVSIWFQNRRARWKTKQLERDYSHLKASYGALQHNYHKLEQEREIYCSELRELKAKLGEEKTRSNQSDEANAVFGGSQNNVSNQRNDSPNGICGEPEPNNNIKLVESKGLVDYKDGLSDSDSCGVLNGEENLNAHLIISPAISSQAFDFSSYSSNHTQFCDSTAVLTEAYQQQQVEMEEYVFSGEESCNIFLADQPPTLYWYFTDQRNQ